MIVQVVVSILWKPGFIWTLTFNSFPFFLANFSYQSTSIFLWNFKLFCYHRTLRIAPCKVKQDSLGFWIPHSNPYRGIPDSFSRIPNFKAQESGFHTQNFPWIPESCYNYCCFSWCSPFLLMKGRRVQVISFDGKVAFKTIPGID